MKKSFFMLFLLIGLFRYSFSGEYLGKFGSTYNIEEKDLIKELYEAAEKIDFKKLREKVKKDILNYKPKNLIKLKKAKETSIYYVKYEYILPEDIKIPVNGTWKVLYKKGFKFNPLRHIKFKPIDLLIFDGSDEKQIRFVKENFVNKNIRVKYVISEGNYREVMKKLNVPVYYLFGKQFSPMKLKYTISRVSVDTKAGKFRIDVYALDDKGKFKDEKYRLDKNSYLKPLR